MNRQLMQAPEYQEETALESGEGVCLCEHPAGLWGCDGCDGCLLKRSCNSLLRTTGTAGETAQPWVQSPGLSYWSLGENELNLCAKNPYVQNRIDDWIKPQRGCLPWSRMQAGIHRGAANLLEPDSF